MVENCFSIALLNFKKMAGGDEDERCESGDGGGGGGGGVEL